MGPHSLIEADDSVLVAIDVQPAFLDKLPTPESQVVLANICWLIEVANWLDVPVVATAEEHNRLAHAPELESALADDTPILNKSVFGLADQPDILAAVNATGRRTAVLVGLETDVCVLHSALGLIDRGLRVVTVRDAVGTPAPHAADAIARMRSAGATVTDRKGLFYEWLRDVDTVARFHQDLPHMRGAIDNDL